MKILLDVGAHDGETVGAAIDRRYNFDRIVCFEPASACWPKILSFEDPRVELCRFGLWNKSTSHELQRAGFLGASIFADTEYLAQSTNSPETIQLMRASDWFAENVPKDAVVFLKLNCEGAECDILDDLMESGELRKVYNAVVSFDVRFIPSLRRRELAVRRRLRQLGYQNVAYSDDVMKGNSHENAIHNWLSLVGATDHDDRQVLEARYQKVLKNLAAANGQKARLKCVIRREVLDRMPAPIRRALVNAWHRAGSMRA